MATTELYEFIRIMGITYEEYKAYVESLIVKE